MQNSETRNKRLPRARPRLQNKKGLHHPRRRRNATQHNHPTPNKAGMQNSNHQNTCPTPHLCSRPRWKVKGKQTSRSTYRHLPSKQRPNNRQPIHRNIPRPIRPLPQARYIRLQRERDRRQETFQSYEQITLRLQNASRQKRKARPPPRDRDGCPNKSMHLRQVTSDVTHVT